MASLLGEYKKCLGVCSVLTQSVNRSVPLTSISDLRPKHRVNTRDSTDLLTNMLTDLFSHLTTLEYVKGDIPISSLLLN